MAEQEQDKSEQATPFKLQEARRKGQVAKSLDFNSFFAIGGLLLILSVWGERFIRQGLALEQSIFSQSAGLRYGSSDLLHWATFLFVETGWLVMPFFAAAVVAAIASNMVQTGPVFSFFPLKPDVQRLNPVQGFKKIFSVRMLFEALKNLIKLALFSAVAYAALQGLLPELFSMMSMDPRAFPLILLDDILALTFKLGLMLLIVALLDFVYVRWEFGKKMRMSRRELKEEVKRREGDPHVRAKIKELQRETVKRSKGMNRVPDADVLITNPTHYAVALRYQRGVMAAPVVIAKGAGELALQMRKLAAGHDVPIVERPAIARQLFSDVDIDQFIPESMYEPVAQVLAEVIARQDTRVRVGVTA